MKQNNSSNKSKFCRYSSQCGGCAYSELSYAKQLETKEKEVKQLLKPYCQLTEIIGMDEPYYYRNKIHRTFSWSKGKAIQTGIYSEGTHRVIPIEDCKIENKTADLLIRDINRLIIDFKYTVYDEDSRRGLFRHILIRTGINTGEILVALVLSSPILPGKNNFIKALLKQHPEITTIVINVNDKKTSMVLGSKETVVYGKGYIEDILCGLRFRISASSFYQVNPLQTEKLYSKAIEYAKLTGKETVVDAYCGIGTIGMIAAAKAKSVVGIELNKNAIADAKINSKINNSKNIRFIEADAGEMLVKMADAGDKADVIFMDPPRAGSTEAFMGAVVKMAPKTVVYVSCNPETLARDLKYMTKYGYEVNKACAVDMFPWTSHVETVCLLSRKA